MPSLRLSGLCAASILVAAGCASTSGDRYFTGTSTRANVYVSPVEASVEKIAIMPFKGPTDLIGTSVSDMFVTEMLRAGRYTLVERSQMGNVLSESEIALAGLSQQKAVEVGNMMGADGVIIGTVDEYGNVARGGKTLPVVGISVRMIHCKSGKVIWSADLAERASDSDTTLPQQARQVVHQITAALYVKWGRAPRSSAASAPARAPVAPVVAVPVAPPDPPTGLKAGDFGLREVTLSWIAPPGADKVRIERASQADGPFVPVETVSASNQSYTDRGGRTKLDDSATYYYRLVALGQTGLAGKPSAAVESMTAPPPDPPVALRGTAPACRAARIEWDPPRAAGVERYRLERCAAGADDGWSACGEVSQCCFQEGGKADSPLADSTCYRYRVASINRVGAVGEWSKPVEVTTRPPPGAVNGLTAARGQVRCVPLSWEQSQDEGIVEYQIERRATGETDFLPLTTVRASGATSFLDGKRDPGNLADDHTYFYRIRARNAVGSCGPWSDPVEATTRPPPPPVTGLAAKEGLPRSVELTWDASPDEKVTGYVLERAPGEAGDFVEVARTKGIAGTLVHDRDGASASAPCGRLADGAVYRYRVRACNTAGALSEWSAIVEARTKPAPAAPSGLTASATLGRRVELAWQANAEPDIVAYVVESREAAASRWREVTRTDKIAHTHTGLDDAEKRLYRVKARDRDTIESAWSDETAGGTRPLPPPPTALTAIWRDGQAVLTWQAPDDVKVAKYHVWKKTLLGLSSTRLGDTDGCEFVIAPQVVGKKLAVHVTTLDDEGLESSRSTDVEILPEPAAGSTVTESAAANLGGS
ncbi:MAG: CsgG/HfaB family protein [Kiritimatiellae bacterium]|nr:CsgG/HfaB family protein [Kiritimatiellia bacterium]